MPIDAGNGARLALPLEPGFYRSFYPDLSSFDDEFLVRHFEEHGEREGRLPNRAAFLASLSQGGDEFPTDFDAVVYRSLYPDVNSFCRTDWDAYRHFAEYGRAEGRRYRELDPFFYWQLYLADRPFDLGEIERHHRAYGHEQNVHASLESLLSDRGLQGRAWIGYFSETEYSLFNYSWLDRMLNRAEALVSFLDVGLERAAKFSADVDFDAGFYSAVHPEIRSLGELFRHWVFVGLESREAASFWQWQQRSGYRGAMFPAGFAWRRYIRSVKAQGGPILHSKWQALDHLIRHSTDHLPVAGWPVSSQEVAHFQAELGGAWLAHEQPTHALRSLQDAYRAGLRSEFLSRHLADACYRTGRWEEAWAFYSSLDTLPVEDVVFVIHYCECAGRVNRHSAAIAVLRKSRFRHAGNPAWQQALAETITRVFEAGSRWARAHYQSERRVDGDRILATTTQRVEHLWVRLGSMPTRTPMASAAAIVMLANQGLRQCTHYRVEQKLQLFRRLGLELRVFDENDVQAFLGALPGAAGAIFYRVPALPSVIKAIAGARLHGIPTYYEVDDLIFDSRFYPDPIESFEGQITPAAYLELMHGVPLFRAAMAMCDVGIASTPTLADHMARVVRTGVVHIVRNGLDERNFGISVPYPRPMDARRPIRIFYGSGTLAHNRDFNETLTAPLCSLLDRFPQLELVIMGHLRPDDAFSRFKGRITTIGFLSDVRAFWSVLANCDINLSVLAASPSNDAKSEIKWLEAAVLGVPSVLSATATYRECLLHGVDAMLVDEFGDWSAAIQLLIEQPELRVSMGRSAREKALRFYSLSENSNALLRALPNRSSELRSKPRILIVNVFFPPQAIGGATRVVTGNIDDWIDTGAAGNYEFFVATADHRGQPDHCRSLHQYRGLPVFRIAPPQDEHIDWAPEDTEMKLWFASVLDIVKPDLVHFHCVQRLTASCVEASLTAEIPYIVSVHDAWWLSDFQFLVDERGNLRDPGDEIQKGPRRGITLEQSLGRRAALRELLAKAEMVLAPSESFAEIYRSEGFHKTRSVPNGVLIDAPLPRKAPSGRRKVRLGHVGNTTAHKGFSLLRAALQQHHFENLQLIALDHGRTNEETAYTVWGATEVEIRGYLDEHRIWDLYAELDVLAAPSIWPESFGLVTREAQAAGLWVIASDRGAIGADVEHGVNGFVIDVSSPDAMVGVLRYINDHASRFLSPPPLTPVRESAEQADEILAIYADMLRQQHRAA